VSLQDATSSFHSSSDSHDTGNAELAVHLFAFNPYYYERSLRWAKHEMSVVARHKWRNSFILRSFTIRQGHAVSSSPPGAADFLDEERGADSSGNIAMNHRSRPFAVAVPSSSGVVAHLGCGRRSFVSSCRPRSFRSIFIHLSRLSSSQFVPTTTLLLPTQKHTTMIVYTLPSPEPPRRVKGSILPSIFQINRV